MLFIPRKNCSRMGGEFFHSNRNHQITYLKVEMSAFSDLCSNVFLIVHLF